MKKSIAPLLFGILFILAGLGYLGNVILGWNFDVMFDGWWTLFIIVPSFVSILANGPRGFNITAFLIGALLLLREQLPQIFNYKYTGVAIVAVVIIGIGVSLIAGFFRKPSASTNFGYQQNMNYQAPPYSGATQPNQPPNGGDNGSNSGNGGNSGNGSNYNYSYTDPKSNHWSYDENPFPNYNAILSGVTTRNVSKDFHGARISAIMGGVDLDLRNAIITHDITIYVTTIMGGVDIFAPQNIRISLNKTDILGGTDCIAYTMPSDSGAPMVTFVCTTIMGGVDIK